jgi:L-ascorbate oxidase
MTVVQSDGNNVQPVTVDEFRIAVAETFDVIVQPKEDKAYTLFAESMGRSAYCRGTLAPRAGIQAEVPKIRDAPLLTMADMGMAHAGMDHGAMKMGASHKMPDGTVMANMAMQTKMADKAEEKADDKVDHSKMDHSKMDHSKMNMGKMADTAMAKPDPFYAAGSGIAPSRPIGGKVLSYNDLKAQKPLYEFREATREIEMRLTGNMERYAWSINDVKYEDAAPVRLQYGERVRFKFVNETMMTHPMHLHGMWSILDNGNGKWNPIKHVISVAPGTTVYVETEVDAPGQWAFHCHLSYHADSGMFRKVVVEGGPRADAGTSTTVSGG